MKVYEKEVQETWQEACEWLAWELRNLRVERSYLIKEMLGPEKEVAHKLLLEVDAKIDVICAQLH